MFKCFQRGGNMLTFGVRKHFMVYYLTFDGGMGAGFLP